MIAVRTACWHRSPALAAGLSLLMALAVAPEAAAQDARVVTRERVVEVLPGMTPAQAKRQAVDQALADAIAEVAGACINSITASTTSEGASGLQDGLYAAVLMSVAGTVTQYAVLDSAPEIAVQKEGGRRVRYRVRVRASVLPNNRCAPGVRTEVKTDRASYAVRAPSSMSDLLRATVTVDEPAYITIFSITPDEQVHQLMPARGERPRQLQPGDTLHFPPRGRRYRVELPRGRDREFEVLLVVATRTTPPPFDGDEVGGGVRVPVFRSTYERLHRWLAKVPAEDRGISMASYLIVADN